MKSAALLGLTGQGIETAGEILSSILQSQGYSHRAWRDFSTIIRGGHTAFEIYISEEGEESPPPRIEAIDIAVVWDDEGAKRYLPRVKDKGLLFGPSTTTLVPEENREESPKLGFNVWSLGIIAGYLGIPFSLIEEAVNARFRGESNNKLAHRGYLLGQSKAKDILKPSSLSNVTISGNDALCLGAIAGEVRHYFGYPITPASEILENLSKWLPPIGGKTYQVEDEIAAIHAAIGASFAGKRTFVASSGPGIALMTEGISYLGATEIPLVIIDNQRGGPSTGMPTKTEQSDLLHLRYAGHGEFARILLSPTNVLDCIVVIQEALNLADYYQCPVIIALDLDLALRRISIPWSSVEKAIRSVAVDRGPTLTESAPLEGYVRYRSVDGAPPIRTIPGIKGGAYVASGDEHDERGFMEPNYKEVRHTLHMRRLHKTDHIQYNRPLSIVGNTEAPVAIVGTGSMGELIENIVNLHPDKYVGVLLRQLHPVPMEEISAAVSNVKTVIVAEYNATGQIRSIIEPALVDKNLHSLLRFDGEHYTLEEFENSLNGIESNQNELIRG
ncbi:2-oxoacid:acceptor oxidoreductase family protein [Aneurinibacillus danicus]|jgi:2-oxoglutarate ferredoxin oxidoreductase subunit alpha|uniref:2-oxoglutarate ferredoxin oxidoreductase subunit alpha n=1 Tax=Aneurinibacillus danicus TaxID=267746 RepID=A0A511VFA3_9BACL|nr:2-oxoacid:acceptor oxidoreductase family protein [Aneurinibacillus danicus]GEN36638.1 2-oxoglutarate ferredoxin oxidoreductase subunit alpha [Aneurinibacillus danicus]